MKQVFANNATLGFLRFTEKLNYQPYSGEREVSAFLHKLCKSPFILPQEIASLAIQHVNRGYKFGLEQNLIGIDELKHPVLSYTTLNLLEFGFETLPLVVFQAFNIKALYLQSNRLTQIPSEIVQLKELNELNFK